MRESTLFTPFNLGPLTLKNRVVMTGLGSALPGADGSVTDAYIHYLAERAKGGAGLIITEVVRPCDGHGLTARYQLSAAHDELIPGMRRLAEAIHAEGTALFFQLHHPGRETFDGVLNGEAAIAPSAIPCPVNQAKTRAITAEEIPWLVGAFAQAAGRVQAAGIDGVELHAGHGYLFHQFLSPHTNKRTDGYGGSFAGRFRFLGEVIEAIRAACGPRFPISVRFSIEDFMGSEAIDLALGIQIGRQLEEVGVDLLDPTVGFYETGISNMLETASHYQGWRNHHLRELKKHITHTPILAVNSTRSAAFAEWMLDTGMVDLVGMGRPFLADPQWAVKAQAGKEADIRPCLSCVYCVESLRNNAEEDGERNTCAVNARTFHEEHFPQPSADGNGRRVAVAGGGPAGLECALTLAKRGFAVTLFERAADIGGQLNIASKPAHKYRIDALVNYYRGQLEEYNVDLRLNTEATPAALRALAPEAVFVATGSVPAVPKSIPGTQLPQVLSVAQVLNDEVRVRGARVTVVGSGLTGLETAEYLAARGNVVSVVEMLDEIGKDVYFQHRDEVLASLDEYATAYYPGHKLLEVTPEGVRLQDAAGGELSLAADYVVLSMGMRPDTTLQTALGDAVECQVIPLGDAVAAGRIKDAVHTGYRAAYQFR